MAEEKQVQLIASLPILDEVRRVLEYEKILSILKRSGREPNSIMATIVSLCALVDVTSRPQAVEEDQADNQILACARDGAADLIISGDRHLLKLGYYKNVKVLTASSFLESRERMNRK